MHHPMYKGVPREGQGERLQHGATGQVSFKGGGGDGPIFHGHLNNDEVQEPTGGAGSGAVQAPEEVLLDPKKT